MIKLKSRELGSYLHPFFFINLNTKETLENFPNLPPGLSSTFIHEYIHFLQDIMSTYGLQNIVYTVDILKSITRSIYYSKEPFFYIPFVPPRENQAHVKIDLDGIYHGDTDFNFNFDKISSIDSYENGLIENYEWEKLVEVETLNSKSNKRKKFHFGSYCLRESMAYLIESELFDNVFPPKFPYRTVEHICRKILPEISENKAILIALCDFALSTTNPAPILIEFLNRMRKRNFIPQAPEEVSIEANKYKFENGKDNAINLAELYNMVYEYAQKSLTDYFTVPYYKPARDWSEKTLTKAHNLRYKKSFSFDKIVRNGRKAGLFTINKIMNYIGIPVLSNSKNQFFLPYNMNDQVILFRAIYEIYKILRGFQKNCTLKDFCKQYRGSDPTCNLCDTEPWEKAKSEKLCAFGQIWKLWGLGTKELKFKNRGQGV